MSRKFQHTAAIAAAMMVFTLTGAATSGAFAQDQILGEEQTETGQTPLDTAADETSAVKFVSQEVVQPLPEAKRPVVSDAASLADLVASIDTGAEMSEDMQCLASAIYFEARGEALMGQLAVGQVVINRAESGKFPTSYCGVVLQRSQFSFVRGGRLPSAPTGSAAWRNAVATARIAHEGLWDSPAKDALYFHAAYVKPAWRRTRVARVDSHVFYR